MEEQEILVDESAAAQTTIYRYEKPLGYGERHSTKSTATATRPHSSPQVHGASPRTSRNPSKRLQRNDPNRSHPERVQHVSTSSGTTYPARYYPQTLNRPQVVNQGESSSDVQAGAYRSQDDEDGPEPRPSEKGKSWGRNLLVGMGKKVVENAANEVMKDTSVLVDSSIDSTFTSVRQKLPW